MRLIDVDALLKWLEETNSERDWMVNQYNADWVYSMIDSAPTIDAVPVVRCGECVKPIEDCPFKDHVMLKTDFCSYGERKDGEG